MQGVHSDVTMVTKEHLRPDQNFPYAPCALHLELFTRYPMGISQLITVTFTPPIIPETGPEPMITLLYQQQTTSLQHTTIVTAQGQIVQSRSGGHFNIDLQYPCLLVKFVWTNLPWSIIPFQLQHHYDEDK